MQKFEKYKVLIILQTALLFAVLVSVQSKSVILIVISILLLISVSIRVYLERRISIQFKALEKFEYDANTDDYSNTRPLIITPLPKYKHGILFIHGFSAVPTEFDNLLSKFKDSGSFIYAPLLTGFGKGDLRGLKNVKYSDWVRDVLNSYDLMTNICESVDVAGHSMGGLLVCKLAEFRKINKIVLTAPYLTVHKCLRLKKKLLTNPVIYFILSFFLPYAIKSDRIGNEGAEKLSRFIYDIVPANCVKELWRLQEMVNYSKIQFDKMLIVLGGTDTTTVNSEVYEIFKPHNNVEFITLQTVGHNIIERAEEKDLDFIRKFLLN